MFLLDVVSLLCAHMGAHLVWVRVCRSAKNTRLLQLKDSPFTVLTVVRGQTRPPHTSLKALLTGTLISR